MQTAMQPTNYAVFIALLIIAALVGLLGAYLANGQVVDGDLTYWPLGETPGLPGIPWESYGVAMLGDGIPVATFDSFAVISVSVFDGAHWRVPPFGVSRSADIAEGPDGKVWFKTWKAGATTRDGGFYLDLDGVHPWRGPDFFFYSGYSVDVLSWAGRYYSVVGWDPCWVGGVYIAEYCAPSCERFEPIASLRTLSVEARVFGCRRSGHFILLSGYRVVEVFNLLDGSTWDVRDTGIQSTEMKTVGTNCYFWPGDRDQGLVQLDALTQGTEPVCWAEGAQIGGTEIDWRGLWIIGQRSTLSAQGESPVFIAFWSFQEQGLDEIRLIPGDMGLTSARSGIYDTRSRHMSHSPDGSLWFSTEKAVCRWTPDPALIPMPYEARVEAQEKEGGAVGVSIEFDNLRIIRNDADLMLALDYLVPGSDEPLGISPLYALLHEFEPQETFTYSFEHIPDAPPEADRIRYRVFTTFPEEVSTITSNVATAEVMLD